MGGGAYRLEKRNASSYSIDGNGGSSNGQNVHMWSNNNNNQNQHWVFEPTNGSNSNDVVTMRKRNASNYALDGGNGSGNGNNVKLWRYNASNVNQQWIEIDRGGGYYSYQKMNTNHCIDGSSGGSNGNNVKLWACNSTNRNQQFKKISMGGGAYRLEKRNASSYSIDGNGGSSNGQNVHMWSNNNNNRNQHWIFTVVGSASPYAQPDASVENSISNRVYPNPTSDKLYMELSNFYTDKDVDYAIMNIQGQRLSSGTFTAGFGNIIEVDVTDTKFSTGTYFIALTTQDTQQIQKFVVLK